MLMLLNWINSIDLFVVVETICYSTHVIHFTDNSFTLSIMTLTYFSMETDVFIIFTSDFLHALGG